MQSRSKAFRVVFVLLVLLHVMLMSSARLYPFIDLPNHLAAATILRYSGDDNLFREYYHVRPLIGPNVLHLVFTALPLFPSVEFANKLFYMIYAALFPLSLYLLIRRVGGNVWFSLLAFPLMYHFCVQYGFVGYTIAVPLVLLMIAFALDWFRQPVWWKGAAIAALLLLIFWAHGITGQFAPAFFLLLALVHHLKQPRKLALDFLIILPAVGLDMYWWNVARDTTGTEALAPFLSDYYSNRFLALYARRKAILTQLNFALLEGNLGRIVSALISLVIVGSSLFFTTGRWKDLWARRREPAIVVVLLLTLFSILCYLLLPGGLADSNYLYERMAVFVFASVILIGSLLSAARVQKIKVFAIAALALAHFALWADYMHDFKRDSADFTPALFAGLKPGDPLGGLIAQNDFRSWDVYRHFPNYFIVWRHGIATTRLVDYPLTYIERNVPKEILPAYSEWSQKNGDYDGRYDAMNCLLIRGNLTKSEQVHLDGFHPVARSGQWKVLWKEQQAAHSTSLPPPAEPRRL